MDKRIKILLCVIAIALVVTIVTTSYAFFTIANKEGEENIITSGTMGLHLTDGPRISANNLLLGQSIEVVYSLILLEMVEVHHHTQQDLFFQGIKICI